MAGHYASLSFRQLTMRILVWCVVVLADFFLYGCLETSNYRVVVLNEKEQNIFPFICERSKI